MNWQAESEQDRDLIEHGAKVFQAIAMGAAIFCLCGLVAAIWSAA